MRGSRHRPSQRRCRRRCRLPPACLQPPAACLQPTPHALAADDHPPRRPGRALPLRDRALGASQRRLDVHRSGAGLLRADAAATLCLKAWEQRQPRALARRHLGRSSHGQWRGAARPRRARAVSVTRRAAAPPRLVRGPAHSRMLPPHPPLHPPFAAILPHHLPLAGPAAGALQVRGDAGAPPPRLGGAASACPP